MVGMNMVHEHDLETVGYERTVDVIGELPEPAKAGSI